MRSPDPRRATPGLAVTNPIFPSLPRSRARSASALALALCAVAGCAPNLALSIGDGPGALGSGDLGSGDLGSPPQMGGSDGSSSTVDAGHGGSDGAVLTGNDCPHPQLLALLANQSGGMTNSGRVLRYSLAGGTRRPCSSLDAGGTLDSFLTAMTYIPPYAPGSSGVVAVGSEDGVFQLDPDDNGYSAINTYKPTGTTDQTIPLDMFPLFNGTKNVLGVAYWQGQGTFVDHIDAVDGVGNQVARWALGQSNGPLHSLDDIVLSVTQSPYDAGNMMFVNEEGPEAADVVAAPFDGQPRQPTQEVGKVGNGSVRSIYSPGPPAPGAPKSIAWVVGNFGGSADVVYVSSDDGAGLGGVQPLQCNDPCPQNDYTYFLHAAADPNDLKSAYAVCARYSQGDQTHLVHLGATTGCEEILDANPANTGLDQPQLRRVAIVP